MTKSTKSKKKVETLVTSDEEIEEELMHVVTPSKKKIVTKETISAPASTYKRKASTKEQPIVITARDHKAVTSLSKKKATKETITASPDDEFITPSKRKAIETEKEQKVQSAKRLKTHEDLIIKVIIFFFFIFFFFFFFFFSNIDI